MFVCVFIYTDKKQNRTSVLNWHFEAIVECIRSHLIPVSLVSRTHCDVTLSRYTPWYTL